MKRGFGSHFEEKSKKHIDSGNDPTEFILDQRLTTLRPKNQEWTVRAIQTITKNGILSAWRRAGFGFRLDFCEKDMLRIWGKVNYGSTAKYGIRRPRAICGAEEHSKLTIIGTTDLKNVASPGS